MKSSYLDKISQKSKQARPVAWATGVAGLSFVGWLIYTLFIELSGFFGLLADIILRPAIICGVIILSVRLAKWLKWQRPAAVTFASFLLSAVLFVIATSITSAANIELSFFGAFLVWATGLILAAWLGDRVVNIGGTFKVKKWPIGRILALVNPLLFFATLGIADSKHVSTVNFHAPFAGALLFIIGALCAAVFVAALVKYYRRTTLILASIAVSIVWMIFAFILVVYIDDSLTERPYPSVIPPWVDYLAFYTPMLWALVYIRDIGRLPKQSSNI